MRSIQVVPEASEAIIGLKSYLQDDGINSTQIEPIHWMSEYLGIVLHF
jgi:hypothetical protein